MPAGLGASCMLRLLLPNAAQEASCLARLKFLQPAALTATLSPALLGLLVVRDLLPALATAPHCFPAVAAAFQALPRLVLDKSSAQGLMKPFGRDSSPGLMQTLQGLRPMTSLPTLAEAVLPAAVACLCRHDLISQVSTAALLHCLSV